MNRDFGAVYVEFSILIPLLLLLSFGIYSITLLLSNMSILVPTSYEALYAGAGKIGSDGQSSMDGVSNIFVAILGGGLQDYSFSSVYEDRLDVDSLPVSIVEVSLNSGIKDAPPLAMSGLNLSLVGPHVGRDLSLASENFESLGTYDCSGLPCSGRNCPDNPCTIGKVLQPYEMEEYEPIPLQEQESEPLVPELRNHEIPGLDW
jgi:hypothetical protein